MATPVACNQDAVDWVNKLKEKGIKKFRYRTLPAELKIKSLVHKASALGLIEKAGKSKYSVAVWKVK